MAEIKGYALGCAGMTIAEWEAMNLGNLCLKLRFYNMREENRLRVISELVRLQTLELININLAKNQKIKKASDLWQFAWDNEERKTREIDAEDLKNRISEINAIWQKEI